MRIPAFSPGPSLRTFLRGPHLGRRPGAGAPGSLDAIQFPFHSFHPFEKIRNDRGAREAHAQRRMEAKHALETHHRGH